MMSVRSSAWSAPLLLASLFIAFGQQVGDPTAGKQLAEATCLGCHGAEKRVAQGARVFGHRGDAVDHRPVLGCIPENVASHQAEPDAERHG